MELLNYIGPGLAIGFAGLGVAIGQGTLAKKATEVMGKNPSMANFFLTITILGIALVESAVIYGLVVAFQILAEQDLSLASSIGAGLAIGLTGFGAGVGEGSLIAGALGAIDRNPQIKGKIMSFMVLFVALVEVVAIYGLIVALKILSGESEMGVGVVGAGLAVGLAGLGVAIGQGMLAKRSMDVLGKNPAMASFFLTVTILGIALVESAVIYGLVVAFQILGQPELGLYISLGAGTAIGFAGLGAGVGEGMLVAGALSAMQKNPQIKGKLMTFMVLFVALVEVTAIYGLIIAFKVLGVTDTPDNMLFLGAGLSIGLAGVGVAIGRGYLSEESLEIMAKNSNLINFLLTVSILGVALVESAAIYALIVSFQILGNADLSGYAGLGAGLAIGLTGFGAGVGEGLLIKGALKGISINPEFKGRILAFMVLFVALVEVVAIYGLIIAFKVLG